MADPIAELRTELIAASLRMYIHAPEPAVYAIAMDAVRARIAALDALVRERDALLAERDLLRAYYSAPTAAAARGARADLERHDRQRQEATDDE